MGYDILCSREECLLGRKLTWIVSDDKETERELENSIFDLKELGLMTPLVRIYHGSVLSVLLFITVL